MSESSQQHNSAKPRTVSENHLCDGCPLQKLYPRNHFVEPKPPNPSRDLVRILVGEAPGEQEALEGQAFVGASGKLLNRLLAQAGVDREGLCVTNTLCCRPPSNMYPTSAEARSYISKEDGVKAVKHCIRKHLLPLLESRAWKRVDMIGGQALYWLTGKMDGITKWRGSPIDIDLDQLKYRVRD